MKRQIRAVFTWKVRMCWTRNQKRLIIGATCWRLLKLKRSTRLVVRSSSKQRRSISHMKISMRNYNIQNYYCCDHWKFVNKSFAEHYIHFVYRVGRTGCYLVDEIVSPTPATSTEQQTRKCVEIHTFTTDQFEPNAWRNISFAYGGRKFSIGDSFRHLARMKK